MSRAEYMESLAPARPSGLAGRYGADDDVAPSGASAIKRADFKPGLVFGKDGKTYAIIKRGDDLYLIDGKGKKVGRILPGNSHKGFNLEVEVMGQKTTSHFLFRQLEPIV